MLALVLGAALAAAPASDSGEAARAELRAALEAAGAGDEWSAEERLRGLCADSPGFAPAWIELAALLNRTGRPAAALDAALAAAERAPASDLPLLELARALEALGRPDVALAALGDALSCRDAASTRLELASLLVRLRRQDAAEVEVRAALALEPLSPGAHAALGRVLFYTKRYRDAAASYRRAEELGLRRLPYLIEHGRALEALALLPGAAEVYRRGREWFPADARPARRLGAVLLELGQHAEAIEPLEQALKIEPGVAETHEKLGLALEQSGRREEAVAALGRAVALDPMLARAHYELGNLLAELGRSGEAERSLARFRQIHQARDRADHRTGKIGTLNREGLRLYREGRHRQAIDAFERALALGPDGGAVRANLGLALLAAGEAERAAAAFERAIELDGESEALVRLLAEARAAAR